MRTRSQVLKEALKAFIDSTDSKDKKELQAFNKNITTMQKFTRDSQVVKLAVDNIKKPAEDFGWTELYFALSDGVERLSKVGGRKVLILFSDGYQWSNSKVDVNVVLEDAVKQAVQENVTIFSVGFGSDIDSKLLERWAATTGGVTLNANESDSVAEAYQTIQMIIDSECQIRYQAHTMSTTRREVKISVDGELAPKSIAIYPFFGKTLYPFNYLVLLLLIFALLLLFWIYYTLKRGKDSRVLVNLDTGREVRICDDSVDKHIVEREGTYYIEGKGMKVNNQILEGETKIIRAGDVISTEDGTKILFRGK